jgi:DNA (cytosine-5)-methyltransferase 1
VSLIVDLFAGGGGTSLGIEMALGRSPDVAINHNAEALAMHEANHPRTRHLHGDVWHYAPLDVTRGEPVELLHASPTCTFFSKAKGGPLDRREATKVRALAWVVTRWARDVRPRCITVENVERFVDWCPLTNDGRPCPKRLGLTFRRWVRSLETLGYRVEWRELRACDYGAPTTRNRLFIVARCDGEPIIWPTPTHGDLIWQRPFKTAADCIDWSVPCPSIDGRNLRPTTIARIMRGVEKFVTGAKDPFIVDGSIPWLIHQGNGEREGQLPRIYDVNEPLRTIVAQGVKHFLCRAFIAKHYGGNETPGQDPRAPLSTITTRDHHSLVTVHGDPIVSIGMRALTPRELFLAQGFPDSYIIDPIVNGKPLSKTAQVRMVGNSVAPHVAAAIVAANIPRHATIAA